MATFTRTAGTFVTDPPLRARFVRVTLITEPVLSNFSKILVSVGGIGTLFQSKIGGSHRILSTKLLLF